MTRFGRKSREIRRSLENTPRKLQPWTLLTCGTQRGKWLGSKELARKGGMACTGRTRPSAFSTDLFSRDVTMLLFLVQGGKSFQRSHTLVQHLSSYCVCSFSKMTGCKSPSNQNKQTNKHKHVWGAMFLVSFSRRGSAMSCVSSDINVT